jgi:hypothetical protein
MLSDSQSSEIAVDYPKTSITLSGTDATAEFTALRPVQKLFHYFAWNLEVPQNQPH